MNKKQRRLLSNRLKKTEVNVSNRAIGAARPVMNLRQSTTCFINGKPLVYAEEKRYTVDPNRSQFAREFSHSQRALRTNWTHRERKETVMKTIKKNP